MAIQTNRSTSSTIISLLPRPSSIAVWPLQLNLMCSRFVGSARRHLGRALLRGYNGLVSTGSVELMIPVVHTMMGGCVGTAVKVVPYNRVYHASIKSAAINLFKPLSSTSACPSTNNNSHINTQTLDVQFKSQFGFDALCKVFSDFLLCGIPVQVLEMKIFDDFRNNDAPVVELNGPSGRFRKGGYVRTYNGQSSYISTLTVYTHTDQIHRGMT